MMLKLRINYCLFALALFFFFLYSNETMGQTESDTEAMKKIEINGIEGMQYDVVRFAVKPGEKIQLIFTNKSKEPHNLIFTAPGARQNVAMAALRLGPKGKAMDYVPESEKVLWSTPLIGEGEQDTLVFQSPSDPGIYPYVCTYPGHSAMMYGAMYVSQNEELPDLENDKNIPEQRRK